MYYTTNKNRKNICVYVSEEARNTYKKLMKKEIRMALLIEEFILKLGKELDK